MSIADPTKEDNVRGLSAADMARLLKEVFGSNGFVPSEQANLHNVAVGAAADILAADLAPTSPPCLFRIAVAVSVAGVFSAQIRQGGVTVAANFNAGGNLNANALYFFDMLVHDGDTVNFQHSIITNILVLRVQEINMGTQ